MNTSTPQTMRDVRDMAREKLGILHQNAKEVTRHEAPQIPVSPMENSITAEVDRTTKTTVQKLYSDDYLSDNAVHFDCVLNCKRTQVKFNTQVANIHENGANEFLILDDIQTTTNWKGYMEKFKIKGGVVNWTFDLKTHRYDLQNVKNEAVTAERHLWLNPYLRAKLDRKFVKPSFGLGLLATFNNLQWNGTSTFTGDTKLKYKVLSTMLEAYLKLDLMNLGAGTLSKCLTVGYASGDHHLNLESKQNGLAGWDDWLGKLTVGYAYAGMSNMALGLVTNLNTDDFASSLHNVFVSGKHSDIKYKARVNNLLEASVLGEIRLCDSMNLQTTLSTTLGSQERSEKGFLGNSFNLGLRFKYVE